MSVGRVKGKMSWEGTRPPAGTLRYFVGYIVRRSPLTARIMIADRGYADSMNDDATLWQKLPKLALFSPTFELMKVPPGLL